MLSLPQELSYLARMELIRHENPQDLVNYIEQYNNYNELSLYFSLRALLLANRTYEAKNIARKHRSLLTPLATQELMFLDPSYSIYLRENDFIKLLQKRTEELEVVALYSLIQLTKNDWKLVHEYNLKHLNDIAPNNVYSWFVLALYFNPSDAKTYLDILSKQDNLFPGLENLITIQNPFTSNLYYQASLFYPSHTRFFWEFTLRTTNM
jgi:hypothetical protein